MFNYRNASNPLASFPVDSLKYLDGIMCAWLIHFNKSTCIPFQCNARILQELDVDNRSKYFRFQLSHYWLFRN